MRKRRFTGRRLTASRGARPSARRVARATRLPSIADQRGFTIIEVLVAASVLLVGLLGAVTMIDAASATDSTTKAREQGAGLARELLEGARSIPYAQLVPAGIVSRVQAMPNLGNANAGAGWTIRRRGVTYGVSMGVCSVDDPSDGYGTEDPNFACADNSGVPSTPCAQLLGRTGSVAGDPAATAGKTGTLSGQRAIGDCGLDLNLDGRVDDLTQADASMCAQGACQNTPIGNDSSPDDFKRLVVLVAWSGPSGGAYVHVSSLVTNPGQGSGPTISAFGLQSNPPFNSGSSTITDPAIQSVPFSATADSSAAAMRWAINGTPQGSATNSGGVWTFSWQILATNSGTEVLDGNYVVTATAFDSNGNPGPTRSTTITLNRRQPYAPGSLVGGHDSSFVDLLWSSNREGDISGYRAYRIVGSGQPDVLVCSTNNAKSNGCQDTNPPNASSIQYYVVALDTDPAGKVREGDKSTPPLTVTNSNIAPNPPKGLQASPLNGNTVLLWNAPNPMDSDADTIAFYRIYRDGQAIANRYDTAPGTTTVPATASYTDTATGGVAHTYWVTAVDSQLAESSAAGPVTL